MARGLEEIFMTRVDARANLIDVLARVVMQVGGEVKTVVQRRDRREPGRTEKEKAEDELSALMRRYFTRQAENIRVRLEVEYPIRKATVTIPPSWLQDDLFWEDPEFMADLIILLTQSAKGGVDLFRIETSLGIDFTGVNTDAAKWAREYAYDLIKGITETTRGAVSEAITAFVETPGMTIGDTMGMLQSAAYSEIRARMIATTEITRSYAQGNQLAGEAMKQEFPDVKVVKRWFTNNDDRVCDICGPLDGEEVEIDEKFSSGDDNPPAHVNCRCWTSTRTRIND